MENYTVLPAPYTVGPKAYESVGDYCKLYGTKAVVIGGKKAMAAAGEKIKKAASAAGIQILSFVWFGKDCTFEAASALEQCAEVQEADMIFAVGGGKAIDTAKLVSIDLKKPYFAFPTIASNCAAASALSIVYKEDGSFCDFVHFLEAAKHVFIDTDIIARAPEQYLWAGIGDTYAKYYEVSISARGEKLEHYKALGVNMSRMCMETLVEHGEQALKDNKAGVPSYDLEQAALSIIITTGWVSMLVARDYSMDYNGGIAHAFFYGLCSLPGFDEDHLHGVVVSFGVLLLLLIDGRKEECEKMIAFNKTVGLPVCLSDIGVTVEQVASCAKLMVEDEDVEHYPYKITEEMIVRAARELDR
ncbi:MAG: iron-containing alcohol dehydrogenase family protein [Eubacteriales bacterium]|nr:iron-containing alcohol dehydrogenase family protein [Eubacteriales bacterium]